MGGVAEGVSVATREYMDDEKGTVSSLFSKAFKYAKANLPKWELSEGERIAQDQRLAQFLAFLSKPKKKEIYQKELEVLDRSGIIDLSVINREDWPRKDVNYLALVCMNTYEREEYFMGNSVIQDSCNIAMEFKNRGYRTTYLCNPTPREFHKWLDFFSETVKKEFFVYFTGLCTNVVDPDASERGEITQVFVFRDESKRADGSGGSGKVKPTAKIGITSCTLSDKYVIDLIERAAAITRRTLVVANCFNNAASFEIDKTKDRLASEQVAQSACCNRMPPYKTITVQHNTVDKAAVGVFAREFLGVLKADKTASPRTLKEKYVSAGHYQRRTIRDNGGLTVTPHKGVFSSADILMMRPFISDIPPEKFEMQVESVTSQILGSKVEEVVALPNPNVLSPAEIEGANKRWERFAAEMKKSPSYNSAYKETLRELDELGCINLARIERQQIPNIRIDRACSIFFCPYEGLKHTLGQGPCNDALVIAKTYIAKGYKILYQMDATPKEYYSWMDWILSNIHYEIVSYFSGHGTQTKDITGLEEDGLSELYVFYSQNEKGVDVNMMDSAVGVDEITVADYCMRELILLKDYPETRVVLLSDCCHSGTMFNLDQPVPPRAGRPPPRILHIGAAKDEQTAKQVKVQGKEGGIFTLTLQKLISKNKNATFQDLENFTKENIKTFQEILITTTNKNMLNEPIIAVPLEDEDGQNSSSSSSSSSTSSSSSSSKSPSSGSRV